MKKTVARNETGRSMIEMLGVLAIIGVLSVGGIAGFGMAMAKFRANKSVDDMQTLITNLRSTLAQRAIKEDTTTEMWYNVGLFNDDNYNHSRKKGRNMFDGDIEITTTFRNNKAYATVTYTEVPDYACRKLAEMDFDAGVNEMLESLKIGQTEFNWTTQDFDKQLPVSMESALTACKGDHETDTTTMVWTLRL